MTSPVEWFITYKTATVTFVMFTFIIIIYYILNGRRKSLTELNLVQLDSITIPFSFSLVILKRAPSSVQAFGNPLLPWIPSEFSGCLTISKSCQKAQSYLHTLVRCSVSCLPLSFIFFCSWISFLVPTHPHTSNSGKSNLTDGTTTNSSSDCPRLEL